MHSRIFQIECDPVPREEWIEEELMPEWFTDSVADYVVNVGPDEREDDIDWLMRTDFGQVCKQDGDKLTFNIDVGAFFDESFEKFEEALAKLKEAKFNHFASGGLEHLMFQLNDAYNDKYSFYVWQDGELYTLQSWMRQVKPLSVYYLGGIVDYHF